MSVIGVAVLFILRKTENFLTFQLALSSRTAGLILKLKIAICRPRKDLANKIKIR